MTSSSILPQRKRNLAFTLIELLVVITVISLLLAFSAPALFNGLQASRLSGAGERMLSALSEAQQTAFSQNCVVEMQVYSYQGALASQAEFRSYRLFKVTTPPSVGGPVETKTSIGAIYNLPDGVVISASANLSPALASDLIDDSAQNAGVGGARYAAIRFLPDGSCRKVTSSAGGMAQLTFLGLRESFFTLLEDDGKGSSGNLPANFYTIQTDPYTGKSRSYRPGF
jgi:uncharacterized protein (TIGR02596 family)